MKNTFISHGHFCISNFGGYEIQLSDCGDGARLKYYDKVSRWQEIKFNVAGEPYVTYYGRKLELNNFMRNNINL